MQVFLSFGKETHTKYLGSSILKLLFFRRGDKIAKKRTLCTYFSNSKVKAMFRESAVPNYEKNKKSSFLAIESHQIEWL